MKLFDLPLRFIIFYMMGVAFLALSVIYFTCLFGKSIYGKVSHLFSTKESIIKNKDRYH